MNISSAHFAAIAAFSLWGLFPIFWKFLSELSSWDLFAHRLFLSFFTLGIIVFFRGKIQSIIEIWKTPKKRFLLMLSAIMISSNWLLYIYAINSGQVLEASLGYFLNPIINILIGNIFLKESIRPTQWPPIVLVFISILLIIYQTDTNHIPWIAILLSLTFALYGLIRKMVSVGSMEGLTFETSVMIIPVLIIWYFQPTSPLTFLNVLSGWKCLILSFAGFITSLPLILFAYGAKRLNFSTLGFIQYLSPSLKFICGLFIFHEPLSVTRLQAFIVIWVALAWYTIESYYIHKKTKR